MIVVVWRGAGARVWCVGWLVASGLCLALGVGGAVRVAVSWSKVARAAARAPKVVEVGLPSLGVTDYLTVGGYPQVAGGSATWAATNRTIRATTLANERGFAAEARRELRSYQGPGPPPCAGIYQVRLDRRVISVTGRAVSALLPAFTEFPCSQANESWLALTISPTGQTLSLPSVLFSDARRALYVVARATQRQAAQNSCLNPYRTIPSHGFVPWFAPRIANYRLMALTSTGLAVGFDGGMVGSVACGRVLFTVPFSTILPYLGANGRDLVAAARSAGDSG